MSWLDITRCAHGLTFNEECELRMETCATKIYPIVLWVKRKFCKKDYEAVDWILENMSMDLTTLQMVCFIRAASPAKARLVYWSDCLYRIETELENRGENSSQILKCLL